MIKKLAPLAMLSIACLYPANRVLGQVESNLNPLRECGQHAPIVIASPENTTQDQTLTGSQAKASETAVPEDVWNAMFPARQVNYEQPSPDVATLPTPSLDVPEQIGADQPTLADLLAASNRAAAGSAESNPGGGGTGDPDKSIGNGWAAEEGLVPMLQRIATGTALVLLVGVAFILIAKPWVNGRTAGRLVKSRNGKSVQQASIQLLANFKINAKSTLHLIEAGDQQVLIASDVSGIKSVVALNASRSTAFEDTLLAAAVESAATSEPEEVEEPARYSPGQLSNWAKRFSRDDKPTHSANQQELRTESEIEAEMRRQLAALIGQQAFESGRFGDSRSAA